MYSLVKRSMPMSSACVMRDIPFAVDRAAEGRVEGRFLPSCSIWDNEPRSSSWISSNDNRAASAVSAFSAAAAAAFIASAASVSSSSSSSLCGAFAARRAVPVPAPVPAFAPPAFAPRRVPPPVHSRLCDDSLMPPFFTTTLSS